MRSLVWTGFGLMGIYRYEIAWFIKILGFKIYGALQIDLIYESFI
jgi:hypothetical protein